MSKPMSEERLAHIREQADPTLITGANRHNKALLRDLLDEVDSLRRWKAEAMEVHAGWEEVWQAAGRPGMLGRPKSEGVRQRIEKLEAEASRLARLHKQEADDRDEEKGRADRAQARLDRVKALHQEADPDWKKVTHCTGCGLRWPCATIRAVAADEQEAKQ